MTDPLEAGLITGSKITMTANGVFVEIVDTEARAGELLNVAASAWVIAHSELVIKKPVVENGEESPPDTEGPVKKGGYA